MQRRFYGDAEYPRVFFELILHGRLDHAGRVHDLVRAACDLQMHMDGDRFPLQSMGRPIASRLAAATSPRGWTPEASDLIASGRPLMVLLSDGEELAAEDVGRTANGILQVLEDPLDAFWIDKSLYPNASIVLSRLHIDREILAMVATRHRREPDKSSGWDWNKLHQYFSSAEDFATRQAPYGQERLKGLLGEYEASNRVDWDLIRRVFNQHKDSLERKGSGHTYMGDYYNIWNRDGTVITGEVRHSFNTISQSDPALAEALAEVLELAKKSNRPEAAEVAESVVESVVAEKKGTARALWQNLVKLLPEVAALGTAVAKITAWLN